MRSWIKKPIILFVALALCFYNVCDVKAGIKNKKIETTMRFLEVADFGAQLYTIVNVYSTGHETFTLTSGKKIKYTDRSVYAYFKEVTSLTNYECGVTPIVHKNSSGNIIKQFSWKNEPAIFPADCSLIYSKCNSTDVEYSRSNKNTAQWVVGIYAQNSWIPMQVKTGNISLYYSSK